MRLDEPAWWYGEADTRLMPLLLPISRLYGAYAERRMQQAATYRAPVPVICVGNFTAGGTGKTPFTRMLADHLRGMGETPAILSRGYGGTDAGPRWVRADDTAKLAGDEPLLLARTMPVMIARDRVAGARAIVEGRGDTSVIIMDDGLQNPGLAKDLRLSIVDGQRGFGNGLVIPAGPLRARLHVQYEGVDAIIVNHGSAAPDASAVAAQLRTDFTGPVLDAVLTVVDAEAWGGKPVVAYAGIGVPARFFTTLRTLGADVRAAVAQPDHHVFTAADAQRLLALAQTHGATLVTTEKDKVRLAGGIGALAELEAASAVLTVALTMPPRDADRLEPLLAKLLADRTRALSRGATS